MIRPPEKTAPLSVICDLDGLLVDSEFWHFKAYQSILKRYDIKLTEDLFVQGWLSGKQYGMRRYLERAGVVEEAAIKTVRQEKAERFVELAQGNLKWMPGAREFLAQVREWGWDCGVGTGAHRSESDFIIKECGIAEYVNVWVSGNEVPKNKPHPDVFLKVAEKLGRNPQECIVMENSSMGLKAASEAGMRCFIVPSHFTRQQDFSGAAKQSSRLDEFKRMDFEPEPIL